MLRSHISSNIRLTDDCDRRTLFIFDFCDILSQLIYNRFKARRFIYLLLQGFGAFFDKNYKRAVDLEHSNLMSDTST